MADVEPLQLLDPIGVIFIAEIGEHDHVGDLSDPRQRLAGARHDILSVHLRVEESVEQRPDPLLRDRLARGPVAHGARIIRLLDLEHIIPLLVQPVGEMRHHVQQHFVAIGDEQGPAHGASLSRALTKAAGGRPIASAQAIRSGS